MFSLHNIFKNELTGDDSSSEDLEMIKSMFGDMKLRTVYHFDRKVKSSTNPNSLISADAPVGAATITDVRKMGGVLHYVPALGIFDLAGAELSIKDHIDEALKLMFLNGLSGEEIVLQAGVDAFSTTQYIYSDKKQLRNSEKTVHNIVTKIVTAWFPRGVRLEANPNFAANELRLFAPDLINPVLLRQHKNKACSDPEFDIDVTEDLFEMSLQILDPFAMIQIKNIG